MKFLFVLFVIAGICSCTYLFLTHIRKIDWWAARISIALGFALTILLVIVVAKNVNPRDTWCDYFHTTTAYPPAETKTAMDWFEKGNYNYDIGNCKEAVVDYQKATELNPKYAESYNNKAYTEMRMGNYKEALNDLDKALEINPNYVNALMNRGDVHNYNEVDKNAAIADYEKIISLVGTKGTGVCGHLAMAKHYNGNPFSYFLAIFDVINCRTAK